MTVDEMSTFRHDLKSHLTSIKAYAQLISKRAAEQRYEQVSEYSEKIEMQIDNIVSLVNNVS